jgi:hypothetical protein
MTSHEIQVKSLNTLFLEFELPENMTYHTGDYLAM